MIDADGSLTSPGVDVVLDLENGLELDDLRNRVGNYAAPHGRPTERIPVLLDTLRALLSQVDQLAPAAMATR